MEIIKCRFDFSPVAKGEPDPCREPLPRKSRYLSGRGRWRGSLDRTGPEIVLNGRSSAFIIYL